MRLSKFPGFIKDLLKFKHCFENLFVSMTLPKDYMENELGYDK